jgi:hypothetical protein
LQEIRDCPEFFLSVEGEVQPQKPEKSRRLFQKTQKVRFQRTPELIEEVREYQEACSFLGKEKKEVFFQSSSYSRFAFSSLLAPQQD